MSSRKQLGGVIHTYQKYDPVHFPSPKQAPPDLASPAMEHLLLYGNTRRLTPEELARAVRIDPRQIRGLGPSIQALREILLERKRKILSTYESERVSAQSQREFRDAAQRMRPPSKLADRFFHAVREEQLHDLEQLWYSAERSAPDFARQLLHLNERLGEKYQIDELVAKYTFTGQQRMTIPEALAIKDELEKIDKLLKQLEEAEQNAQIGVIDLEDLAEFAEPEDIENLSALAQQVEDLVRQLAEQQGIEQNRQGFQLTPKAYRIFQSRLLQEIFSQMQASRSGRHQGPIVGEGAVETPKTKPYEFGDSVANMDIPSSMVNAMLRGGAQLPIRMKTEDIEIHETRNNPKCATAVIMDMSGSMRYGGLYVDVKRMALAIDGLIRKEYPGDYLQMIEMYTFARARTLAEVVTLLPKPVTIYDPIVRLKADMSDPEVSEMVIPPHFTNIQHALRLARQHLATQDTPNRQVVLITDGLPTAHFDKEMLYLLYPPDPRTEEATLREGKLCAKEGITLNIFLLTSWNQSSEDIQFAYKLAESTKGRVFFTAGKDLDRYVVWDYISRRKKIVS